MTFWVTQALAFTSSPMAALQVGQPSTFSVTTGSPTPQFSVLEALPSGLHLDALTGALSGTPHLHTGGTYLLTIKATNGVASDAIQKPSP